MPTSLNLVIRDACSPSSCISNNDDISRNDGTVININIVNESQALCDKFGNTESE